MNSVSISWDKSEECGEMEIEGAPDMFEAASKLSNGAVTLMMTTGLSKEQAQKKLLTALLVELGHA